jgi:hypothetical protein
MACGARLPLGFESDTDVRSGSRSYGDAGKRSGICAKQ